MVVYFPALTSKCQAATTKPLDASEGIRIGVGWLLLTDLNNQPSPRLGDCFGFYSSLILSAVWLHKSETLLIDGHQVVFEGSFENNNEVQTVTRLSDDIGHCFYLQGPLNHLGSERRASYIVLVLRKILEFLHI